jgi:hypothetical protein
VDGPSPGRGSLYSSGLAAVNDPDLPTNASARPRTVAIGSGPVRPYANVTDRLGYGVASFGDTASTTTSMAVGAGGQCARSTTAAPITARTAAGVSENVPPRRRPARSTATPGVAGKQENGMENHTPGPSSLYGTTIFQLLLGDQSADRTKSATGLSNSLFDATHRNNVEEFQNWIWLYQASYYRCSGSPTNDPVDPACFAASSSFRKRLFTPPNPASPNLRFDYLWRYDATVFDADFVATSDNACAGKPGVPWRRIHNRDVASDSPAYLHDEGGFGAYRRSNCA